MRIKDGAVIAGVQIPMQKVIDAANLIWRQHNKEAVITEGCGGKHSNNSLHYYGYALDLRTRYFSKEQIKEVARKLKKELGQEYDVVTHETHIHVEWDQAKQLLGR